MTTAGRVSPIDYGQTTLGRDDEFEHQRFSLATATGVNFALQKAYYEHAKRCQYLEPAGEEGRGIHARLLAPKVAFEVHNCFSERFGQEAYRRWQEPIQQPIQKARAYAKVDRFELAASAYREYDDEVLMTPGNQALLTQAIGLFVASTILDAGRLLNGLLLSCVLFWWTALALFVWNRQRRPRLRAFYVRWGSLVFLLVGTLTLGPGF